MTIESDIRTLRTLNVGARRGHYDIPHVSVRGGYPVVAERDSTPATQLDLRPPAHHGDAAQARSFLELLRAEHAELAIAAAALEACRFAGKSTSCQLATLQAEMREIRQLLDALEKRFPSS